MGSEAPSASALVSGWSVDPVITAVLLAAAVVYLGGVRRLRRRTPPKAWPRARTASFGAGLGVLLLATESGLGRYEDRSLAVHTTQHVLIGMVAPLLLCLAAPLTLALQASSRPTKVALLHLLHHRVARLLSHPLVIWALFGGTLFALYFSPLLELSVRNGLVHQGVHEHFLLVGYLFCWMAVGTDPRPRPLAHPARLLFVLLAVPFHAFLGLAILSSTARIGGSSYAAAPASDQANAAGILWAVGDLFGLLLGGIALARWMAADQRQQIREDRILDAQLATGSATT